MANTSEPLNEQIDEQKGESQKNGDELNYEQKHKPSSAFDTREEYLEHELQIMAPKRWRPNLPFRDYRFEFDPWI